MTPHDEIADVVDETDIVIGQATRSKIRADKLLHRGIEIVVRDAHDRVFVHRRPLNKDIYPGRLVIAIGGMVGTGETYEVAARRELREELGIVGVDLVPLFKERNPDPDNPHWKMTYSVTWTGDVRPDPLEIVEGRFVSIAELSGLLHDPELAYQRELLARITHKG